MDLNRIADDACQQWPGHAVKILQRLRKELDRLEFMPLSSGIFEPEIPSYPQLRFCPLPRVGHHVIYYLPKPDGIYIVRVLHGSMDAQTELEQS